MDCLGVVIEIHRRLGMTIPDPLSHAPEEFDTETVVSDTARNGWREVVGGYEVGDVPVFFDNAGRVHVGVLVSRTHMLHATEAHGVIVSPLRSRTQSIKRVYRFDAKADDNT